MAKIELSDISSGYNLSKVNENFQKIEDALNDEVLYRDNPVGEDNALQTNIDANNKRILNLPDPVSASEPIRKQEWDQTVGLAEQYRDEAEGFKDETEDLRDDVIDLLDQIGPVNPRGDYNTGILYQKYDVVFDASKVLSDPGAWYLAMTSFTSTDIASDVSSGFLSLWQGATKNYVNENFDKTFPNVNAMQSDASLTVGQTVSTIGYYTAGDMGGNSYEVVASGTGLHDGGSFIDLTASGLQAKALFRESSFSIEQFGYASGNFNATFQSALDFASSRFDNEGIKSEITFEGGSYVINAGAEFVLDISKYEIDFKQARIDATAVTSGVLFQISSSETDTNQAPFSNAGRGIKGNGVVTGNNASGTATCIKYGTLTLATHNPVCVLEVNVLGFETILELGDNSHELTLRGVFRTNHPTGCVFRAPSGLTNSGERVIFDKCFMYNSTKIFEIYHGAASYYANDCSLDYSTYMVDIRGGAELVVSGGHIETNLDTTIPITVNDDNTILYLNGTSVVQSADRSSYELFESNSVNGGIVFDGVKLQNSSEYSPDFLVKGDGRVLVKSISKLRNADTPFVSKYCNLYSDPYFAGSSLPTTSSWNFFGSSAEPVIDATYGKTGGRSMLWQVGSDGQDQGGYIDLDIPNGLTPLIQFYWSVENVVGSGNFYVSAKTIDTEGNEISNIFTVNLNTGTELSFNMFRWAGQIPQNYSTRIRLQIETGASSSAAKRWIDDLFLGYM